MDDTPSIPGSRLQVLYPFEAQNPDELTCEAGGIVVLIERKDDWLLVKDEGTQDRLGLIPAAYVQVIDASNAPSSRVPTKQFMQQSSSSIMEGSSRSMNGNVNPFPAPGDFGLPKQTTQSDARSQHSEDDLMRLEKTLASLPPLPSQRSLLESAGLGTGARGATSEDASVVAPPELNPFDILHQQSARPIPTPIMDEDDHYAEELAQRLQALKTRMASVDQHIPVGEVVAEPTRAAVSQAPSMMSPPPSGGSYPTLNRPTSLMAMEEERRRLEEEKRRQDLERRQREQAELQEGLRQRLQKEAEERAREQRLEAERREIERKKTEDLNWQKIRTNSVALSTSAKPQVKYMTLASERLQEAAVAENNGNFPKAVTAYKEVLKNIVLALDNGQIANKSEAITKMDEFIAKLSKSPFSSTGSFEGKIEFLIAMNKHDNDNTVFNRALLLRSQGFQQESEGSKALAIKYYRDSIEHFIAVKKYSESRGIKVDPSLVTAIDELLVHAENLKKSF